MFSTSVLEVPAKDGAIRLGLLEKQPAAFTSGLPPVLLLHGATFPGCIFDLPRRGYSLLEELAGEGRAAYALDVRGYGRSRVPEAMDSPPELHPSFPRSEQAVLDVAAAVEFICERQSVAALDIAGFSWGTITAARFAGQRPDKVRRLVLYAPLYRQTNPAWLMRLADSARLSRAHGAYTRITRDDVMRRWNGELPDSNAAAYREDGIVDLLFDVVSALDPRATEQDPPAFCCPCGAQADLFEVSSGRPLYDPGKLVMPTFLVRGAHDTTSTDEDCRDLLAQIPSTRKLYESISPGSHFLCLERNRGVLYDKMKAFFGAGEDA
jgi:pimeloyl-ACP methyl ester carboxylesterase